MNRDLWSELARKVRQGAAPTAEMPFGFEDRVLERMRRNPGPSWNPLAACLPLLRPAVGLALVVSCICIFLSSQTTAKAPRPSTDFVSETVSIIQMAVLDE
jgi:hypothetical protein